MKNMVKEGKSLSHVAASDISSGDVVVLGKQVAVAMVDISTGKQGELALEGVFELPSDTGTAYDQGDQLFWDSGNSRVTKTASGNVYAGIAEQPKLSAATTARVKLAESHKQAAHVADASSGSAAEINALRDALIAAGLMASS